MTKSDLMDRKTGGQQGPAATERLAHALADVMAEAARGADARADTAQDGADRAAVALADAASAGGDDPLPDQAVARLIAGDSPVRVWREHRGLTQTDLAARAGIDQATVSEIEHGKVDPRWSTMRRVAGALGVPLDDLAPWGEDEN